ncbi:MAG: hypothetical protein OM95_08950 [Bdellovibrio sp. ArHS]|uniref:hypothetical protein n=1 Tax=Bdellovibrio sp. ArHS TaxID=1569284 RepID=UPI00058246CC|nr:hypothetical protein [Bdellovibrio sp. ArHS]KHD88274.1 MAG: hypothetical protein OM95_08950 [Bdellovibrio sp. ArHS]
MSEANLLTTLSCLVTYSQRIINSSHSFALNNKKQIFFLYILVTLGLSACSLEAQITNVRLLNPEFEIQERKEPDFIYGEVVTTYGGKPGYEVKAVFGEISEKTKSLNGNQWQLEGVFYE